MILHYEGATHQGKKRNRNEDRFFIRRQHDGSLLMAVADGVGGMPEGEKAADMALGAVAGAGPDERIGPERLLQLVMCAQQTVLRYALGNPEREGMGTTLTVAVVRDTDLLWAHVGDSRLYLLHSGELRRLTADHRFLSSMIADGDITAEEALTHPLRNMLEQCVGCSVIEPDQGGSVLEPGDFLLLCTDGLYGEVPDDSLTAILTEAVPLQRKADLLLETALENGGRDNITLVLVSAAP